MKQQENRIAAFIESLPEESHIDGLSAHVLNVGMEVLGEGTNKGDCSNKSDSCKGSANWGACVNDGYCEGASNGGACENGPVKFVNGNCGANATCA